MAHATLQTFGYPDTVVCEYDHWAVLLRPRQVTLGSLVLVCKEDVERFSDINAVAFVEFPKVVKNIENTLNQLFQYNKINYLMLMMKDPHVHFHILPRYETMRAFERKEYQDFFWPGPADITSALDISAEDQGILLDRLKAAWKD